MRNVAPPRAPTLIAARALRRVGLRLRAFSKESRVPHESSSHEVRASERDREKRASRACRDVPFVLDDRSPPCSPDRQRLADFSAKRSRRRRCRVCSLLSPTTRVPRFLLFLRLLALFSFSSSRPVLSSWLPFRPTRAQRRTRAACIQSHASGIRAIARRNASRSLYPCSPCTPPRLVHFGRIGA